MRGQIVYLFAATSLFALASCNRGPRQSAARAASRATIDEVLAGRRDEWLAADAELQHAAVERIITRAHPDLTAFDVGYRAGVICGQLDRVYSQPSNERIIQAIDKELPAAELRDAGSRGK